MIIIFIVPAILLLYNCNLMKVPIHLKQKTTFHNTIFFNTSVSDINVIPKNYASHYFRAGKREMTQACHAPKVAPGRKIKHAPSNILDLVTQIFNYKRTV